MSMPSLFWHARLVFTWHFVMPFPTVWQHWITVVSTACSGASGVQAASQAARTRSLHSAFALPLSPAHWVVIAGLQLLRLHGLAAPAAEPAIPTARRSPSTANVP